MSNGPRLSTLKDAYMVALLEGLGMKQVQVKAQIGSNKNGSLNQAPNSSYVFL